MNEFFYISSGSQNKMYTLRMKCKMPKFDKFTKEVYYVDHNGYWCNLSTDFKLAVEKAKEQSVLNGIPFVEHPEFELDEITRNESTQSTDNEYGNGFIAVNDNGVAWAEFVISKFGDYNDMIEFVMSYQGDIEFLKSVQENICAAKITFNMLDSAVKAIKQTNSEYIGEVGDKIKVNLELVNFFDFPSAYGTYYINKLVDENGNVFIYKGNKLLRTGSYAAKVKGHEDYKGTKQTQIERPKLLD